MERPDRASTLWVAGIGAVSMITGSSPAMTVVWMRTKGRRPSSRALSDVVTSSAADPSEVWLAFPALITPSGLNTVLRVPSFSTVDSRMPSSWLITVPSGSVTGAIWASKRPSSRAAAHGLRPLARIHTAVIAADDPVIMLTAPITATAKALAKAGLGLDDLGVYEVNEAFAPVPLAWLAETGADRARLNPRGGAIALGHPLGASGARIMTTMLQHMRQNGLRYGLQTMCEGGGMANATIIEIR